MYDTSNSEYVNQLYSKPIKVLDKYVMEVIKEYEYEGSPIYNGYIDRETLNQMIDKVIEKGSELEEINEIALKENLKGLFNEKILLRGLIELIIVNELFVLNNYKKEIFIEPQPTTNINVRDEMSFSIKIFEDDYENEAIREVVNEIIQEKVYFGNFL